MARGEWPAAGLRRGACRNSGERVCPTLRLLRPAPDTKRAGGSGCEQRAGSPARAAREQAGSRSALPAGACPELGVRLASHRGAEEAARRGGVRVRGPRGVGAGAGRRARARAPGQPGRPLLPVTAAALLVGSLEGSGGGGGGGGCSRHLRRRPPGGAEMWPLVAALLLGSCCCGEWLGDPGFSGWCAAPGRPRRSVGCTPAGQAAPGGKRGEGGGMRGPCAPRAPPWEGPAGHRRLCLLALLCFLSLPFFPPRRGRAG